MKRLHKMPAFWILIAAAALYAPLVVPYWKPTWDSGTYITLAQSMAEGKGYSYLGDPHVKYPPGFPLLLTPILFLFGKNYLLMRALIAACAIGSIAAAFSLIRKRASFGFALAAAVMTAACYAMYFEATRVLSDLPYMLASLGALLAMERYRSEPSRRLFWTAVALAAASYSIRIVGFTLAPAFALSLLIDTKGKTEREAEGGAEEEEEPTPIEERLKRAGVVLGVMALAVCVWMGRNALVKSDEGADLWEAATYERELVVSRATDPTSAMIDVKQFVERLQRNAVHYSNLTASLLTGKKARSGMSAYLLTGLACAGWFLSLLFRRRGVMEYYAVLYAAVFLIWPAHQGERFLVPILPMIFFYALTPFAFLLQLTSSFFKTLTGTLFRNISIAVFLTAAAVGFLISNGSSLSAAVKRERAVPYYQGGMADYMDAFVWVKENAPEEAVLIANRAPYGIITADRPTYTVPWVQGRHEMKWESIERVGGTHAIASSGNAHIAQLIEKYPSRFREIERFGAYGIYEILERTTP